MTADEAVQDVQDAIAVGFDGFALNTHDVTSSYATDAISDLFAAASGTNFKLFISCDVSWGSGGSSLSDFASLYPNMQVMMHTILSEAHRSSALTMVVLLEAMPGKVISSRV
jgi:hypothetical protein